MTFKRLNTLENPEGIYAQNLYLNSFPSDERRDLKKWADISKNEPDFFNCVVLDKNAPVGLLTYWTMPKFAYVEHLAVDPSLRGNGIGAQIVRTFCQDIKQPVVLEVERPDNEIARRRIAFYQRCGFRLWLNDYMQPPYREGDELLPLYLMAYGNLSEEIHYIPVRNEIYKRVYNYCIK